MTTCEPLLLVVTGRQPMRYIKETGGEARHNPSLAMTVAPIYAQLREKAVAKQRAHDRKIFNDACRQVAAHMDALGLAELFSSERTKEINQSWIRIWDVLNQDRTAATVEFKIKGVTYWLTRD